MNERVVRDQARWVTALRVIGFACALAACGGGSSAMEPSAPTRVGSLSGVRWTWLATQCVDGTVDFNQIGFERNLTSEVRGSRVTFTYDTVLAEPACASTEIWTLRPAARDQWQFTPEASVTLPVQTVCGPRETAAHQGMLRLSGDTLEETRFASAWCRGFDARFTYRRVGLQQLSEEEIVRRYVAHWNRRDAAAVSALFSAEGLLIEPFTRSPDGAPVRHEGRASVEAWLVNAFATTPWLALQLVGIEDQSPNQPIADWRYMDARLAEPLVGRNLFVMAGGEIFATELQLLGPPVPSGSTAAAP